MNRTTTQDITIARRVCTEIKTAKRAALNLRHLLWAVADRSQLLATEPSEETQLRLDAAVIAAAHCVRLVLDAGGELPGPQPGTVPHDETLAAFAEGDWRAVASAAVQLPRGWAAASTN